MATSFDPRLGSKLGHDNRRGTYTETECHKLEISHFYIKNALKMYVKYTKVKPITKIFNVKSVQHKTWFRQS